nr:TfoX/Sxy family protein [candidate division Zixibacteria bacterium]
MGVSEEYREYILERLEVTGRITSRRMFGGLGLYLEGVFFALVSDNVLYFKVDEVNRRDYETAGMAPFSPYGENSYSMSYYEVPEEIIEDDQALAAWSFKAYEAALRNKKPSRKRKTKKVIE